VEFAISIARNSAPRLAYRFPSQCGREFVALSSGPEASRISIFFPRFHSFWRGYGSGGVRCACPLTVIAMMWHRHFLSFESRWPRRLQQTTRSRLVASRLRYPCTRNHKRVAIFPFFPSVCTNRLATKIPRCAKDRRVQPFRARHPRAHRFLLAIFEDGDRAIARESDRSGSPSVYGLRRFDSKRRSFLRQRFPRARHGKSLRGPQSCAS